MSSVLLRQSAEHAEHLGQQADDILEIPEKIHTCLNCFLGGPRDPHDPPPSGYLGVAGVVGAAWFYDKRSNARARCFMTHLRHPFFVCSS